MQFRCSILNVHTFRRNRYFLIVKKANKSSFSLVLFSIFAIIFKTPQTKMVTILRKSFFQDFFPKKAKRHRISVFSSVRLCISTFKKISQSLNRIRDPEFAASPS